MVVFAPQWFNKGGAKTMAALQRNHYIPKLILKNWVTRGPKYSGVHVYDIREGRSYFANANGPSAFPFAIADDLYVTKINGKRATSMETWFSGLEDSLAHLIRQAHARRDDIKIRRSIDSMKIVMALIGLEYRSRYDIQMMQTAVAQSPALKSFISNNPERDVQRIVLENVIHLVTDRAQALGNIEITFLHTAKRFLCSDRPFVPVNAARDRRFVVLTNKCMASYQPSDTGLFRYEHQQAHDDLVDEMNRQIVLHSRDWVVAESAAELNAAIAVQRSDDWAMRKAEDHVATAPLTALTSGWSIKEDGAE